MLLPVVNKTAFLDFYRQMMDEGPNGDFARKNTADVAVVFAVFACASRLLEEDEQSYPGSGDEGGTGMAYYERSVICRIAYFMTVSLTPLPHRALALHYISHASIQIAHVQCLILLSSFLCSVNCLPQAWLLIGQAVRMGQDLGLHVCVLRSFTESYTKVLFYSGNLGTLRSTARSEKRDAESGGLFISLIGCSH